MRNLIFICLSCLLTGPAARAAGGCDGRTTSCWSSCESGYVPVAGDKCETFWNSDRSCYDVRGNCEGDHEPQTPATAGGVPPAAGAPATAAI